MTTKLLRARGVPIDVLRQRVARHWEESDAVILDLGPSPRPETVLARIRALVGKRRIPVYVRHSDFTDYFQELRDHATDGAIAGIIAAFLWALISGEPITLTLLLKNVLIGAMSNVLYHGVIKPAYVKVYRYGGTTRVKFSSLAMAA